MHFVSCITLGLACILFNTVSAFTAVTSVTPFTYTNRFSNRRIFTKMVNNDLSIIQKYKSFFDKESVSNLFQDISQHKIDKLFTLFPKY